MCLACYNEFKEHNNDKVVMTPAMEALVKQIVEYYEINFTGGDLHVVLDDWNLDDGHIINSINATDDPVALSIANAMLGLTPAERYELLLNVELEIYERTKENNENDL